MCDTIAGELLVCFHDSDPAGAGLIEQILAGEISHVEVVEHLGQRLGRAKVPMRKNRFMLYRLRVPVGQESYKIGYLQFYYKHALFAALGAGQFKPEDEQEVLRRSNYHLQVAPHYMLSVRAEEPLPSVGFTSAPVHQDYKKLCGLPPAGDGDGETKRVVVLDTGLDPASKSNVVRKVNFVDEEKPEDTADDHGHGTAVTEIIRDLCPTAEFIICKVADNAGRASEWDTLAALSIEGHAQIANISLAFGLGDIVCPICGRESHSSRSAVFENMMNELNEDQNGPLIIAAAGNGALAELAFPARFDNVIAVESINKAKGLSQFSNRSAIDHAGDNHKNVFVLPGGEKPKDQDPTEYVGTSKQGAKFYGTSFAAAYASGLVAAFWSQPAHAWKDREAILDHLRETADKGLPNYAPATHGNGLMQFG